MTAAKTAPKTARKTTRKAAPKAAAVPANNDWWNTLPADYPWRTEGTELDRLFPLQVNATAAIDRLLSSGLGTMISIATGRSIIGAGNLARDIQSFGFYREMASEGDADKVFGPNPPAPEGVILEQTKNWRLKRRGITPESLRFASTFQPLNPELREDKPTFSANDTVHAQLWRHDPKKPRKTLLFLHGYSGDMYWFNAEMFSLGWFYKQGYDIALMTFPHHGPRAEKTHPFSGYGFFSRGMAWANEAMLQAVHDARSLISFLKQEGAPSVGVSGLSLGGYITSVLAVADDRLAFAIPNSPVVSAIDLGAEWWSTRPVISLMQRLTGLDIPTLRHGMAIHSPMTYPLKIKPEQVLMIAGAGDRFTPPRYVRALNKHWPGSQLIWFPGNHLIHLQQERYLRKMLDHMEQMTQ